MPFLVVVGKESGQRLKYEITSGAPVRIGRAPKDGIPVPWDLMISREYADLVWIDNRLHVACLDTARNPVFRDGRPYRDLKVSYNEEFQIGNTNFHLEIDTAQRNAQTEDVDETPFESRSFRAADLDSIRYDDTSLRLELLEQVPHIIESAGSDADFASDMAELLLKAIPKATAIAAVQIEISLAADTVSDVPVPKSGQLPANDTQAMNIVEALRTVRVATRDDALRFSPSRRLINSALQAGEATAYVWGNNPDAGLDFTISADMDWAFCCPIPGESSEGWCLYVAGAADPGFKSDQLQGDIKYTTLAARLIGSVRQLKSVQACNSQLSRFFSPSVVSTLQGAKSPEPVEGNISILFCDVRGFSRLSESSQENLQNLLGRINAALEVMTQGILAHRGAIADFQGDAALGFWGWPNPIVDGPIRAARAALQIRDEVDKASREVDGPLEGFRVGIGLSHGWAIAGTIGTAEQSHLTVLGHVVNLGSRLEGLTKKFKVSILMDVATAQFVRQHLPEAEGVVRKLARVRPAGMDSSVTVFELIPTSELDRSEEQLAAHEKAVDAFIGGDWKRAAELLEAQPDDETRQLILGYMQEHAHQPPADWDGAIRFDSK